MMTTLNHRYQQGVALFTVLLVVFLASATAVSLASIQQFAIRRNTIIHHQQQARLYALGAEQFAVQILKRDRQESSTDHLNEDWASPLAVPVDGGQIIGNVKDMQGCFNLNTLLKTKTKAQETQESTERDQSDEGTEGTEGTDGTDGNDGNDGNAPNQEEEQQKPTEPEDPKETIDKAQIQVLERQLEDMELDTDLAMAIADWIDPDQETRFPGGAEDGDYVGFDPPYRAANRPLTSRSELRLIRGFYNSDSEKDPYDTLVSSICVLPTDTKINVNTASAEELTALAGLDLTQAGSIVDFRQEKEEGFANVNEFCAQWPSGGSTCPQSKLSVKSDYFMIKIQVYVGEERFVLNSLLHRSGEDNSTRILMRRFGNEN